jgi:hypothetical protein
MDFAMNNDVASLRPVQHDTLNFVPRHTTARSRTRPFDVCLIHHGDP